MQVSITREARPVAPRRRRVIDCHSPDCDASKVERVNGLLGRRNEDPAEVSAAILSLTDAELSPFGLKAFQMNMLALLGDSRPVEQIRQSARAALINKLWLGWECFYHYLPRLAAGHEEPHLEDLPLALIEKLLARGRGLVIATFHQGHFRHLACDLAIAGVPVCMPLAEDAFQDIATATRAAPDGPLQALTAANVEEIGGLFKLAKVLASGGCICATIDGNTGLDGTRGNTHRVTVDILRCRARVKAGLIRMAAAYGAPVLPIFAVTIDGRRKCCAAPAIDPGRPLPAREAQPFVERTIRRLYALFGESLLSFPDQWSGCQHFHLWRSPDTPLAADQGLALHLMGEIDAGGRAIMNARRIVDMSRDDDLVCVDVKTLQCYRLPGEMRGLLAKLFDCGGVDATWLGRHERAQQSRMRAVIQQLAARGGIHSHSAHPPRGPSG